MTASWEANLPREFTLPATVGLVVVLVTIIILLAISSRRTRKLLGVKGTKYVVDEDGAHVVRRSTRSTKKPSRFEPVLHGQGETTPPPKESSLLPEKASPKAVKTPKVVQDAIQSVTETPPVKKALGRPRKTPTKEAASPPSSPMRTRRGAKTPK